MRQLSYANLGGMHTLFLSQSFNHMFLTCLIQRQIFEHCHAQLFACSYDIFPQTTDTTVRISSTAFNRHLCSANSQSSELHRFALLVFSPNFKHVGSSPIVFIRSFKRRTQSQLLDENIAPYICLSLIRTSQQCLRETKTGFSWQPGGKNLS